jgi:hypothetical protein
MYARKQPLLLCPGQRIPWLFESTTVSNQMSVWRNRRLTPPLPFSQTPPPFAGVGVPAAGGSSSSSNSRISEMERTGNRTRVRRGVTSPLPPALTSPLMRGGSVRKIAPLVSGSGSSLSPVSLSLQTLFCLLKILFRWISSIQMGEENLGLAAEITNGSSPKKMRGEHQN